MKKLFALLALLPGLVFGEVPIYNTPVFVNPTAPISGGACTNQFIRSLDVLGVPTCATVGSNDLASSLVLVTPSADTATATTAFKGPLGSTGVASFANTTNANTGIYFRAGTVVDFVANGTAVAEASSALGFYAVDSGSTGLGLASAIGNSPDVIFRRDAASIAALKNGTNGQTFRIYGTTTGPKHVALAHDGTNASIVLTGGGAFSLPPVNGLLGQGTTISRFENTFSSVPAGATGLGLEVFSQSSKMIVQSYDRTGAAYKDMVLNGIHTLHGSNSVPTISACGTSPSITGADEVFRITMGTGGVATSCTVTFGNGWTIAPICVSNHQGALLLTRAVSTTTTVVIDAATPLTASGKIDVICRSWL